MWTQTSCVVVGMFFTENFRGRKGKKPNPKMVNWSGLNFVVAQTLDVLVNCCPAADQVLKWNLSYWSPVNGVSFPTLFTKWEIGERDFLSMLSRLPSKLFTLEWPAGPISSQWRTSLMGEKRSSAISWSEVISRSSRHLNLARTSLKAEPVFTRRLSFFFSFPGRVGGDDCAVDCSIL